MKYPVWFFRLLFAAWMIPAGLNHFVQIFPQPLGNQPLSMELIVALINSHLFDLVKAVELLAGIGVLFGLVTPLSLLVCLPVSFGVFYWDAPLEGWGSIAALFGYGTLFTNSVLCAFYWDHYKSMFTVKTSVNERQQLVMIGRIVLGALVTLVAVNYLFVSEAPTGQQPLADLLMTSLVNSRLLYVALAVQLIAGLLLLSGFIVPLALTAQMIITSNALFWALILNQSPMLSLLTLVAFAINGLLMIAYLPYYRDILKDSPLARGETADSSYDALFINPHGSTSKAEYITALVTIVIAMAFFGLYMTGRTAEFCMLVMVYPAYVLVVRRFHDMGYSAWLLLAPLLIVLVAFDVQLGYYSMGEAMDGIINWLALAFAGAFMLWGCVAESKQSGQSH